MANDETRKDTSVTVEIKLPALGEGVEEADVLDVLVEEGDEIELEQGIIEVETEKASAEIPCTKAGKVEKIHVSAGDTIHVGDVLLTLAEENGEESDDQSSSSDADAKEKENGHEEEEQTKKVKKQKKKKKEKSSKDAASDEPAEEKADSEPSEDEEASDSDSEDEPPAEEEEEKEETSGEAVSGRSNDKSKPAKPAQASASSEERHQPARAHAPVAASPAVRRYAREVDVDLEKLAGTGSGGRITRDDVKAEVSGHQTTAPPKSKADEDGAHNLGEPDADEFGEVRIERLSKLQQTMARRMLESWTTIPRVTNFDDADVTELEQMRQASKADYAEAGVKLTILPLIAKAVALTLKHHPLLNAVLDADRDEIRFKQYVNLGIAIDTDRGLVVPSLRQADLLSVAEIARRIERLSQSAHENKLTREDFYGSTFTISNLGSIGGTYSTPIINPPELAILLLGRARRMRVFVADDREEPRLMLPLSLSYDHRLVDGATAAKFLNELKTYLEAPTRLLMAP